MIIPKTSKIQPKITPQIEFKMPVCRDKFIASKSTAEPCNEETEEDDKDTPDKIQQMFLQMSLEQIRQSLRIWIENVRVPQEFDIELLSVYFKKLALDSKIDDLFVMLKFFYK